MDRFRRFDEAFYHRFYEAPETRCTSPEEHEHLAGFVFSFARWHGLPLGSVLDVGAGVGLWRDWIARHEPGIAYTGVEASRAMCERHGYLRRDIARWRGRSRHDLVICQSVLQYLPDDDVEPAVANMAAMARGLLFVEAATRTDLRERCDRTRTDADIFLRSGAFYRRILGRHFHNVGAGLWWIRGGTPPFYELEMAR